MNYKLFQYNNKIKTAAAAALIFLFSAFLFFNFIFVSPAFNFPIGEIVSVDKGLSLAEIADFLQEKGVVKSSFVFRLTVNFLGGAKIIKAGDYLFEKPYSSFEIARKMIAGDYGVEYEKILIREGETIEEIAEIFEKNGFFKKGELFAITGCCAAKILPSVSDPEITPLNSDAQLLTLEGFLFPDTYFFAKNISAKAAVKIILKNFDEKTVKFQQATAAIGSLKLNEDPKKNFYDILIMASLLEKEAHVMENKKIIADILWRRLAEKMPLQVDAALQYITGRNTFELTKNDLKIDSPYNTYRYTGLPPTPISNPGIDSIEAALNPSPNPYWYYLSDKTGTLHYSKTFEEHKRKKARYLSN